MNLSYAEIISAISGVVRSENTEKGIELYRFTKEQESFLKGLSDDVKHKISRDTAGIVMRFKTDSESLNIKLFVHEQLIRIYFVCDVVCNGKPLESITNSKPKLEPGEVPKPTVEYGEISKSYCFPKGEKVIEIYFPYYRQLSILEISLNDGAVFKPVRREKLMLTYGDSITHGSEAAHPRERYASRMCEYLGADEYCKAIGGDLFRPQEAAFKDDITPDYISVAYGTNDWSSDSYTLDGIAANCRQFCENLRQNYPHAPIILITPIWRKDLDLKKLAGDFNALHDALKNAVSNIDNVFVVCGRNLVPEDEECFADRRLHPNSKGFKHYSENLINEIKKFDL